MREYLGADRIEGPLVAAEGYGKAAYGELVEVHTLSGTRLGQVLTTGEDLFIAELWSDTAGLKSDEVVFRFLGETFHVGVSREMLGRVFDGLGRPRDGLPPPLAETAWRCTELRSIPRRAPIRRISSKRGFQRSTV